MYYCGKRIQTPGHKYGPEIRNYYLFVLVNQGEASFFHKNGTIKLKEHDMLIMCPGEKIYYEAQTLWSIQWVGLYGQTVEKHMCSLGICGENPIIKIENYREMEEVFEELYSVCNSPSAQDRCKELALIYHFFSLLWEKGPRSEAHDIAERVKKILDYNFNRNITMCEIANTLHLDGSYITRKFVEKYAVPPKEYLIQKRMELAKRLLLEAHATVTEVAISVGYEDPLYFSRIFKKRVGISPILYKNTHA